MDRSLTATIFLLDPAIRQNNQQIRVDGNISGGIPIGKKKVEIPA